MIRVKLRHVTDYVYDRPVMLGPQVVRLRPAPHCRTPVPAYSLRIEPAKHFCNWQQDPFGNWQARLITEAPTRRFSVEVDLVAELTAINPFDFFLEPDWEHFPALDPKVPNRYPPELAHDLAPFLAAAPAGPRLRALVDAVAADLVGHAPPRTVDFLVDLNRRIWERVGYVIRLEPGIQTPEETLEKGSGSCRDSGWLLVQALRHLGIAARFASGYLIQLTADEKPLDGPAGPDRDFTDLHAWAECYLPGAGWIGLDPTSSLFCSEGHLPLACTPDPGNAAPIVGGFSSTDGEEATCEFRVEMSVERIHEEPRSTAPLNEHQWQAVLSAGDQVDARLAADDVRLTMGGEPTFVAVDGGDAPEWNTEALGADKRRRAGELTRRLKSRFSTGGLLHVGQGKWYPGEQLPRWALTVYWRQDGIPVWRDSSLLAGDPPGPGVPLGIAEKFADRLAKTLDCDPANLAFGFEDIVYHLWRERRLPVNVDIFDARLDDPVERDRLARIFTHGLGNPVGLVLPLAGWRGRFHSGKWDLRSDRLFLIPGDSPMGYRLPVDSLPWLAPEARVGDQPRDPFAPRPPLGQFPGIKRDEPPTPPSGQVRTALCIEPRDGHLNIFLPPMPDLESFLALVSSIEDVAAGLGQPVQIEGYRAPVDHRLRHFSVTPDPGVIEVNVQPAASWREQVAITAGVYEEARACRLASEKFMIDGRHTGTGGGNHITIGGVTPADSPFLRRPDVLASLICFWNNHPSLSYLFSGLFIGPTSQAPRIDEARDETVPEVDLALRSLARHTGPKPPWLIDRTLRNLLVDVTGNTHRAEFSIDKLYPPESQRYGLVELRGFEMPPHQRLSSVQQLLVRALVSRCWRTPYAVKPVRWGTEIHDRWMLPQVVTDDFAEVLDDLSRHGIRLDPAWFAAQHEFRFPHVATFIGRGVEVELRTALEPWPVLGEEAAAGGTARYVDSSMERMQVLVQGAVDGRHALTCNGRRVPLRPTNQRGQFVAGVRYRAWQPPNCLHPNIGVHTPLRFDLVDTWNDVAVAGCTYHVSHPGGRAYEHLPVNAREAESRRLERAEIRGHTPGRVIVPPLQVDPSAPYTLDLRWPVG
ncbi:IMP dehydrogenase [Planctomycetota bacterium]|nr:IMP dehydrogenase [Planctomycetota bacterium]